MKNCWKICYAAYSKAGVPLDEKEQFTYANIVANTADEAVSILRDEFNMMEVKTFGKPMHFYVYDEEYDKE